MSIAVPPGLALAVRSDQLLAAGTPPPCDAGFDYCLYLRDAPPAPHVRSAGLTVNAREDLRAQTSCLLAQPRGWRDLQPGVLLGPDVLGGEPGTVPTDRLGSSRFGDVGQGAAGSYTLGEVLRLFDGERCWEFETRLGLARPQEPPSGAAASAEEAEVELLALLASALQSVTLDSRPVSWPEQGMGALDDFVRASVPAEATSPLSLRGEARGTWFFEGSFPVWLLAEDGTELASGFVTAQGEWMTEGFVAFEGELEFAVDVPTRAVLVLARDNPSDLPENDAAARYHLTLLP